MERRIFLATTQLDVTPAPLAERLRRAESLVTRAARADAQLVALPELFNTGYAYRDENFALAETTDGPTAQWMKQISARLRVHLAGSRWDRSLAVCYEVNGEYLQTHPHNSLPGWACRSLAVLPAAAFARLSPIQQVRFWGFCPRPPG